MYTRGIFDPSWFPFAGPCPLPRPRLRVYHRKIISIEEPFPRWSFIAPFIAKPRFFEFPRAWKYAIYMVDLIRTNDDHLYRNLDSSVWISHKWIFNIFPLRSLSTPYSCTSSFTFVRKCVFPPVLFNFHKLIGNSFLPWKFWYSMRNSEFLWRIDLKSSTHRWKVEHFFFSNKLSENTKIIKIFMDVNITKNVWDYIYSLVCVYLCVFVGVCVCM